MCFKWGKAGGSAKKNKLWNEAKEDLSEQYANRTVVFLDIIILSFQSGWCPFIFLQLSYTK